MRRTSPPRLLGLASILLALVLLIGLAGWGPPALQGAGAAGATTPIAFLPLVARPGLPPTRTPTATSVASATSTATASPTATATATPTTTPQQGCTAAYPIAIAASTLNENGFVPPTNPAELPYYGLYSDETYTNKTQRRLYLTAAGPLAGYGFLSWLSMPSGGSITDITAALSGTGTLAQGFDEVVPWPDPNTSAPTNYPLYPHQLTVGDWVKVYPGSPNSAGTTAALTAHVSQKTVMSLPIVDNEVGQGSNEAVHFARMGNFLLRGFSFSGNYLDLVYLGQTN